MGLMKPKNNQFEKDRNTSPLWITYQASYLTHLYHQGRGMFVTGNHSIDIILVIGADRIVSLEPVKLQITSGLTHNLNKDFTIFLNHSWFLNEHRTTACLQT